MAPGLPRTSFNSSKLVRFLAELASGDGAPVADSKQSFAERLGQWLDWTDAISLSTALNSLNTLSPSDTKVGTPLLITTPFDELSRVRNKLAKAIAADALFAASFKPLTQAPGGSMDEEADFSAYRRQYLVHQRAMDAGIGPLRAQLRAALASQSAALGRLAALDAVLDEALGARERHLLSKVPRLLEKRFEHLHKTYLEAPVPAETRRTSSPGRQPAGWLTQYGRDMQGVLLAELELRLHPVEGLLAALAPQTTKPQ